MTRQARSRRGTAGAEPDKRRVLPGPLRQPGRALGRGAANPEGSAVSASVSIGALDSGAFGLAVELDVHAPKLAHDDALALVHKAHELCPYSNATRGNVDVVLQVV